ncbi:PhoX family protein [Jiangella asiatica]|uniref:PhoX family phosphatase n=1 Tax=Jiangella asiatica TaxID=2530372 RepID=A0A4R5CSL6_9ACTN|nr:PhoX family phosphatase [Jiangella asiatica]TDE00785.1 PhoX family phosphatase [Jiangella asiatica]
MPDTNDAPEPRRRLLPLLTDGHGGRSAMTCKFRCGNACAHEPPNTSDNAYFGDIVTAAVSRRGLLRTGAAAAVVVGTAAAGSLAGGSTATASGSAAASGPADRRPDDDVPEYGRPVAFTPVAGNTVDSVIVPNGYDWSVTIAWGEPVEDGAPAFEFDGQTSRAQRKQFGYNCDFVAVLPLERQSDHALLWVNHEYTNEELMFRGWPGPENATDDQLLVLMAAHGGTILEIERVDDTGEWRPATRPRRYNRRIHAHTEFRLTGPAAGSDLLRTSADPDATTVLGMLNNCAGGTTPWGTILTGEENINQYFGASAPVTDTLTAERYARYGIRTEAGTEHGWERVDPRFDVIGEPNEPSRFGFVCQIDPYDPDSTPRKLTALGRFKHEGATTALTADGRVAVYMGDDERYEYVYKFVSARTYRDGGSERDRDHNLNLLDEGDLYVARFTGDSPEFPGSPPADGSFDGTGEWLPLVVDGESQVDGMSVEEVLVFTRLAADAAGATRMDRPEDVEPHPVTGTVYIALTNNDRRTPAEVDEANPRPTNRFGHVIGLDEDGGDAAAATFTWRIVLLAGDPEDPETYYDGFDKSQVSMISCPDNIAFDPAGRLWLATDGMPSSVGVNDGMFVMPIEGDDRGHLRRFASVPVGAECCGPFVSADGRTAFIAVQHPGEEDGASPDAPASTFPYGDQPRPSVVTVWRKSPSGGPFIGD